MLMDAMDIEIQCCTSLELLVTLAQSCGLAVPPNDPLADLARILATQHGRAFVALVPERAIGMAVAGYEGRRGWIYYVGVIPEARRRGVASKLIDKAANYLGSIGAPKVLVFIREGEEHLIGYYARLGFERQAITVLGKELDEGK